MTAWRMAFRAGKNGHEMWPHCQRLGVAAIEYSPVDNIDSSWHSEGEPRAAWSQLAPSQQASLKRLVYKMEEGDVIYVKQGPKIVGKGVITGPYQFDKKNRIQEPNGAYWQHQRPVSWIPSFPEVHIVLGQEIVTVKPLSEADVKRIEQSAGPIDVDEQDLTDDEIDKALRANRLRIGIVPTDSQQAQVRQRRGQARIRKLTVENYGARCAVCDITDLAMLIASHVVGWAEDPEHRGDLSNVICLCRIHDALFEAGYWSLGVRLDLLKKASVKSKTIRQLLDAMISFRSPAGYSPAARFVKHHREKAGFGI